MLCVALPEAVGCHSGSVDWAALMFLAPQGDQQQRKDKRSHRRQVPLFTADHLPLLPLFPLQARGRRLLDRQGLHGGVQEHFSRALPVPEAGHLRRANGQFAQGGQ